MSLGESALDLMSDTTSTSRPGVSATNGARSWVGRVQRRGVSGSTGSSPDGVFDAAHADRAAVAGLGSHRRLRAAVAGVGVRAVAAQALVAQVRSTSSEALGCGRVHIGVLVGV